MSSLQVKMSGNLLVDSKTLFPPVTTVFMVTKFLVIAMKAVIISLDLGNSRQRGWSSSENG
ncbi:hypothetical protein [Parabacteroides johnsonii]|uniref:hypothetical protein n=1 Tax=Parabacteroides johnsonii TaxID=387661 RepID=UPI00101DBEFD|nr:hypothetical protein [Parabacteroides johnsonii]UEA90457.1 hypothetical protein LK449_18295 [Parabacteroides johnsonii]UWP42625.1 hypothetical protein NQ564_17265 [Parabacteroides johnsonii DSM 18315]